MLVENQRCFDLFVASLLMLRSPKSLQLIADDHALWQEKRESRTFLGQHEEIHLLADLAVVSLFRFLQFFDVGIQFFLGRECSRVNSLQHLSVGIASPVSARHAHQLERLNLTGGFHVRPRAQVRKISLCIHRDDRILRQVFNQFHFVVLISLFKELKCFLSGNLASDQRQVLLHDLFHFLLNLEEIFFAEFMLTLHIVIESVVDSWSNRKLGVRPQVLDGLRHDVRRGMSVGMSNLFIFPV